MRAGRRSGRDGCTTGVRQFRRQRRGAGPQPDRAYVELSGGPLDGLVLDVTGWSVTDRVEGALLITDRGLFGSGGRAFYASLAGDVEGPFLWQGDTP